MFQVPKDSGSMAMDISALYVYPPHQDFWTSAHALLQMESVKEDGILETFFTEKFFEEKDCIHVFEVEVISSVLLGSYFS